MFRTVGPVRGPASHCDCPGPRAASPNPNPNRLSPMLQWSETFETGSTLVDTQHRVLIEKLNELEEILRGPLPTKAACDEFLDFLGAHVTEHFAYEEDCMHRARCPAHAKNRQAHAAFLGLFAKFQARYAVEGPQRELLQGLQIVASDWTRQHILTTDVKLRPCLVS